MQRFSAIRSDGKVLLDSGIVYFSQPVTEAFLDLYEVHPLDSCTHAGLDQVCYSFTRSLVRTLTYSLTHILATIVDLLGLHSHSIRTLH